MGTVYAATHLELGETFALKFLTRQPRDPATVRRFLREARAAARLKDEHVVRVFDVGRTKGGDPFLVMEYLEGRSLRVPDAAESQTLLSCEDGASYALQICEALADAHAHGIVHRDVKPANLFLIQRRDGRPLLKVLDFGISKVLEEGGGDSALTTTSNIIGSPSYASPEQVLDPKNVDTRADLWGVGVTLYTLLTGVRPFAAETPMQAYMLVLNSTPTPLGQLRPDLPAPFVAAVMRCLEKERESRFADVAELARALEAFAPEDAQGTAERVAKRLADKATVPLDPGLDAEGDDVPPDSTTTTRDDAPPMERRVLVQAGPGRRRAFVAAGAVALVGGYAALSMRSRPAPDSTSASAVTVAPSSVTPAQDVADPQARSIDSGASAAPSAAVSPSPSPRPGASPAPRRHAPAHTPEPPARDPRSYR
jgi:serine/threonine-protein kinase